LGRLSFSEEDAQSVLSSGTTEEVIYFDPMFDDINEKSLPKKEMRIFRSFIGHDMDAKTVVEMAKKRGPKRLVVKRPRLSKVLLDSPNIVFEGKATRYDVYLP
jgi:16S rRNA (guanine1516-N2)-methyltransferase